MFACVSLQSISLTAEGCLSVITSVFESDVRHSFELETLINCSH